MFNRRNILTTTSKGNLLKVYLLDKGLSYAEFAAKMGCSAASVCLWVNDKTTPSPLLALKIQKVTKESVPITNWGYAIGPNRRLVRVCNT